MNHPFRYAAAAFASGAAALAFGADALAGEAEDALIAKVVSAYGGDRLRNMKSIRINDVYKNAFPGQGYTSGYVEFTPLSQDARIDLAGERGSVEGWSANWNFDTHTRQLSAGEEIVTVNYRDGTYQHATAPDFFSAFGIVYRVSDTLLAYQLAKSAQTAKAAGEENYLGRPHKLITFEMPQSPPLTLHVDAESGVISKMTRETAFGALTYLFSDHKTVGGVGYASSFEFFIGKDPNIITTSRNISVNTVRSNVFSVDRGIVEEPARVSQSEMTVDEIAEGVHLAGVGGAGAAAYTAFIDAGDHVIAVGGYAGLKARYDAYKDAVGHSKPIRYQIVTHHHTDHLGGMADALALGATFVSPANAVENVSVAAGETPPADRLIVLDGEMTLGPVKIYDIATSHAESYALVYAPGAKVAFQADHYTGNYEGDTPTSAGVGAVTLKKAIDDLGLDVDILLSAHGRKAVPWAEFETAVENYDASPCPSGRAICG
ncbi:MAG: hypothetical protein R3C42_07925 [Parvularculaceae bacterium]|nr:hypothetical protein [Parvularculaceae bacterium]